MALKRDKKAKSIAKQAKRNKKFGSSTAFSIKSKVSRFTLNLLLNCRLSRYGIHAATKDNLSAPRDLFLFAFFVDEQTTAAAIF